MCLATYEIKNFEFLLGINIWYGILFVVNFVSKVLQSKDMHIDVVLDHLKSLIGYLKNYRKMALFWLWIPHKKWLIEIDIELEFRKKRVICRKLQFDKNVNDEIKHFAEDSFRMEYFLYIVDQPLSFKETRFEQFLQYETIFCFLFAFKKFKTLSEDDPKKYCINLEKNLRCGEHLILMV